jgi:hypothetical protein
MSIGFSASYNQASCQLGVKICALCGQQTALTRGTFDLVDSDRVVLDAIHQFGPPRSTSAERVAADLNRCQIPPGCEAVVPVCKEQILSGERDLQAMDFRGISDRPDLMKHAPGIGGVAKRRVGGAEKCPETSPVVIAPEPQAPGIGVGRCDSARAASNPLRGDLLMRKYRGISPVEEPRHPVPHFIAEALRVQKERGVRVSDEGRRVQQAGRFFAGNIDGAFIGIKGAKRQQVRHAVRAERIAGKAT